MIQHVFRKAGIPLDPTPLPAAWKAIYVQEDMRLRCCKHVPDNSRHMRLEKRLELNLWHKKHGPPQTERGLFDYVHAIMRCLWKYIPTDRAELVESKTGEMVLPKTARSRDEFAHKFSPQVAKYLATTKGKPSEGAVRRSLDGWLSEKCRGQGKCPNGFSWIGFFMTPQEIQDAVNKATNDWLKYTEDMELTDGTA